MRRCEGGQFVAHLAALPGNPYDGHTLAKVVPEITRQIGANLQRIMNDAGDRGYNVPKGQGLSVFTSGKKVRHYQKNQTRPEPALRPRTGNQPSQIRLPNGPHYLKGGTGDAATPLLAAIDYIFRLLIAWITLLWDIIQSLFQDNEKTQYA